MSRVGCTGSFGYSKAAECLALGQTLDVVGGFLGKGKSEDKSRWMGNSSSKVAGALLVLLSPSFSLVVR